MHHVKTPITGRKEGACFGVSVFSAATEGYTHSVTVPEGELITTLGGQSSRSLPIFSSMLDMYS